MSLECGVYQPTEGFSCTGSDESHIWKLFHDSNGNIGEVLEKFHCGTCQRHAHMLFLGLHSLVSLGIGKNLTKQEYKDNFMKLYNEINQVYVQAVRDGRL